jgi:hypothetical protein
MGCDDDRATHESQRNRYRIEQGYFADGDGEFRSRPSQAMIERSSGEVGHRQTRANTTPQGAVGSPVASLRPKRFSPLVFLAKT